MSVPVIVALDDSKERVAKAIEEVDSRLQDKAWLSKNRKLPEQELQFAYWVVTGVGRLTADEMARVAQAYADKGWRAAYPSRVFHNPDTNWQLHLQANV